MFIVDGWTLKRLPYDINAAAKRIPKFPSSLDVEAMYDFDKVLTYAIAEDHVMLLNVLFQTKYKHFLVQSVKKKAREANLSSVIDLLARIEALGIQTDPIKLDAFYSATIAANHSDKDASEWIPMFSYFLQCQTYSDNDLFIIDDELAKLLSTSFSAKLLDLLMSDPRFPVTREQNKMSEAWFTVMRRLMDTDHFALFRKIVTEWINFRRNVIMNKTQHSYVAELIPDFPEYLQEHALISYAIEKKLTTYVWVLTGRTYVFRTLCVPAFIQSRWGQELHELIPALKDVQWASATTDLTQKLMLFLQSIMHTQSENGYAETLLLSSSYWQGNSTSKPAEAQKCRETYLEQALKDCSKPQVLAAARNGILTTAAIQKIYATDCFRDLAFFKQVDKYCGPADMMGLHYGGFGLAMIHLLAIINNPGANFYELKKAKRILSQASCTGNLTFLCELDELKDISKAEIKAHNGMPLALLAIANSEPGTFSTSDDVLGLLSTFNKSGCQFCCSFIIKHITFPVFMNCLSLAIEENNVLLPLLTEEAVVRSDESRDDCLEDIYNAIAELSEVSAIRSICEAFPADKLITMIGWAAADGYFELISLLLSIQKLGSTKQWYTALKASRFYREIFELLWNLFPTEFESDEIKRFVLEKIQREILCPALDEGYLEVASIILEHAAFPHHAPCIYETTKSLILECTSTGSVLPALEILLWSPYASENLDLAFDQNALLKGLLELGEADLARALMKNFNVFSTALKEGIPALFKIFTELKPNHAELSEGRLQLLHRSFIRGA